MNNKSNMKPASGSEASDAPPSSRAGQVTEAELRLLIRNAIEDNENSRKTRKSEFLKWLLTTIISLGLGGGLVEVGRRLWHSGQQSELIQLKSDVTKILAQIEAQKKGIDDAIGRVATQEDKAKQDAEAAHQKLVDALTKLSNAESTTKATLKTGEALGHLAQDSNEVAKIVSKHAKIWEHDGLALGTVLMVDRATARTLPKTQNPDHIIEADYSIFLWARLRKGMRYEKSDLDRLPQNDPIKIKIEALAEQFSDNGPYTDSKDDSDIVFLVRINQNPSPKK